MTRKSTYFCSKKLSDEEMLELLRKKAKQLGHAPTVDSLTGDLNMPNSRAYGKRFGSWRNALRVAGLKSKTYSSKKLSDEEILELLRKKAEQLGHAPTADSLTGDLNMPNPSVYEKRFGSWSNALRVAGLKSRYYSSKNLSDEELLKLLRDKVNKLGHIPTKKSLFGDPDLPKPSIYVERFDSWTKALELAGFKTTWSDEELILALQARVKELGYVPTTQMVEEDYKLPSAVTYQNHFGSWNNALEAAGFEPNKSGRKSKKRA